MNPLFLFVLIIMIIMMLRNNIKRAKTLKRDQGYVGTYSKLLRGEEGAAEELDSYVASESDPQLKNKAMVVKIYQDLNDGIDVAESIRGLDLNVVFNANGRLSREGILANSENFIWAAMVLCKAKELGKMDVLEDFFTKYKELEEVLNPSVEYNVIKGVYEVLTGKEDEGEKFLSSLLNGDYQGYLYDKSLVGMYKDIAAAVKVYKGETVGEFENDALKIFATKQVGSRIMKSLGIIDNYIVKEEEPAA